MGASRAVARWLSGYVRREVDEICELLGTPTKEAALGQTRPFTSAIAPFVGR